jgi:hypothetical protein
VTVTLVIATLWAAAARSGSRRPWPTIGPRRAGPLPSSRLALAITPPGGARALALALDRLMGDPAERRRLVANAPEVAQRFGAEKIMSMWEELVVECASHG